MAIEIIDNFNVFVGRNIDNRFGPYANEGEANGAIDEIFRYKGLTVLLTGSGDQIEYWYYNGITNSDLVPKTGSVSLSITGSDRQVVFYSGSTAISGSPNITYDYTNNHFFVTGSTTLSGSTFLPGINDTSQQFVLTYDPNNGGQVYYTASNALSAVSTPLDISDETSGNIIKSSPTFINFTGSGVTVTANGAGADVYIPGGGGTFSVTGLDNQVVFFSGSTQISGSPNFTYDYINNIIELTGSLNISGSIVLTGSLDISGSTNVIGASILTGSSIISGSTTIIGISTLTGSFNTSGSTNTIGTSTFTGSFNTSGSTTVIGTSTLTGSFNTSGSTTTIGTSTFTGSLLITGSTTTIGTSTLTGSLLITGSTTLTGSMFITGAISASSGPNTVGFFGTASWAQNALTSSFITASNVWGPFGSNSVISASYALGINLDIQDEGTPIISSPTFINFTGSNVIATPNGSGVDVFVDISATATASFTNLTIWEFTHSLNNRYVVIQTLDTEHKQIIPEIVELVDTASARITFPTAESGYAIATIGGAAGGGGGIVNFNSTSSIIGNDFDKSFDIVHNFGTKNLHVTIYENGNNYETVYADVRRPDDNTVRVVFASSTPPSSQQFVVYISQ